ncbi:hypothetical protein JCM11251_007065 [Rhodosporidiobolus azoricus]
MLVLHSVLLAPSLVPLPRRRPRRVAPPKPVESFHQQLKGCWKWIVKRTTPLRVSAPSEATAEARLLLQAPATISDSHRLSISTSPTLKLKKKALRSLGLGRPPRRTAVNCDGVRTIPFAQQPGIQCGSSTLVGSVSDEDLLTSPPLSPLSSRTSLASPPPSPIFDCDSLFAAESSIVIRSSSYAEKVSTLEDYLKHVFEDTLPSNSDFCNATRVNGMSFIEAEERYELQYDARRLEVQDPRRRRAVMARLRGGDRHPMPWIDSNEQRLQRFEDRLERHMGDFLAYHGATPSSAPFRFRQGPARPPPQVISRPAVRTASRLSTVVSLDINDGIDNEVNQSLSFVDLSSLRICLDLPPPPAPTGNERAVYERYGGSICEEFPLRSLLVESLRTSHGDGFFRALQQEHYREWVERNEGKHATNTVGLPPMIEEDDDEGEEDDLHLLAATALCSLRNGVPRACVYQQSTTSDSTAVASTWADLADEDEDAYFSAPPSFA